MILLVEIIISTKYLFHQKYLIFIFNLGETKDYLRILMISLESLTDFYINILSLSYFMRKVFENESKFV